jgi:TrmH family RNA methyltransferase
LLTARNLDHLRVVLVSARNPLNIGAAARALSNFGFSHLRVVNPYEVAFRRARSAVGASSVLTAAQEYGSVAEAIADCTLVVGTTAVRNRKLQHPFRRLEAGASLIRKRLLSRPVALLFGSEKFGLSNDDLSHCHWLMRIPTGDENISMNLGQAVAVCLYEVIRDSKTARAKASDRPTPARMGEVERITQLLLDALDESGYIKPGTTVPTQEKVRRLIRRLSVPAGDTEVWLGILRQILWKVRK